MNFLLIVQCLFWQHIVLFRLKFTQVQVDFIKSYTLSITWKCVLHMWFLNGITADRWRHDTAKWNVCNRRYHLWHVKLLHGGKMDGWLRHAAIHQFCCEMVIYIYVLDLVSFTGTHQACFLITHHNQQPAEVRRLWKQKCRKTMEQEEGIPVWRSEFFRNKQSALS